MMGLYDTIAALGIILRLKNLLVLSTQHVLDENIKNLWFQFVKNAQSK